MITKIIYGVGVAEFEASIKEKEELGYVFDTSSLKIHVPKDGRLETFYGVVSKPIPVMKLDDNRDMEYLFNPLGKLKEVIEDYSGGYFDIHKITYEDLMKILQNIMELATK